MFTLKKLLVLAGATAAIAVGALALSTSKSSADPAPATVANTSHHTTNDDTTRNTIPNELIDYPAFRNIVVAAEGPREASRLGEADFLAAMAQPGTVLLDARSSGAFALRHITGAVNLPYTDWTEAALATVIPNKTTRVLIYCNNNFLDSQISFATKAAPASLNLLSYTSLIAYGYTNIAELGPALSTDSTLLPFSGSEVEPTRGFD